MKEFNKEGINKIIIMKKSEQEEVDKLLRLKMNL